MLPPWSVCFFFFFDGDDDEEPEAEDARTLPVLWSPNGYRARGFQEAARMLEVSEMDEKDFPLDGPRSSSWFITSMANSGTTPLLRHSRWVSESGVGADSRSGHEHSILSHVLEKAVCIDQLNVVNLVSLEIVVRRLGWLEEPVVAKERRKAWEERRLVKKDEEDGKGDGMGKKKGDGA